MMLVWACIGAFAKPLLHLFISVTCFHVPSLMRSLSMAIYLNMSTDGDLGDGFGGLRFENTAPHICPSLCARRRGDDRSGERVRGVIRCTSIYIGGDSTKIYFQLLGIYLNIRHGVPDRHILEHWMGLRSRKLTMQLCWSTLVLGERCCSVSVLFL